ncbi:TPA: hypothetical protein ACG4NT_000742 [Stenotrophomonas maltophilia]|uniref:hypothetical protein n=1 Tax=Stenotrophomonas TaxID=40323 RepID=UPI0018D396DA|nr:MULTISPECIES: hypothetical protein [unclassified Stenotrophomonas]MBH1461365.1 hypothetical protein [Stenotrophomonas maltophilia]MDH0187991.1 DUF4198 domain-containing protein [Stenotrophomonas sp. GD04051]MDH0464929.1 DUF4198 domain-containing protein [Stenotrophomonas sp. GD03993]MDH0874989.1 DUF4198 domain-containing protein [Stenotrophomonas sp. GD03877]MDH2155836.1 DUF4198 domain-containing protein [Stenotrophomonas sp. GD03657]
MQYNGKPLPHQAVEITEAVWSSDRTRQVANLKGDAAGHVRVPHSAAGTWIALTRYRTPAPAGAPVATATASRFRCAC